MHADRNTAISLAVVLAAWFLVTLVVAKGLFSQETAAWIQAFGSIGAIAATGYFALLPTRLAEQRRLAEQEEELNRIVFAFNALRMNVGPIRKAAAKRDKAAVAEAMRMARVSTSSAAAVAYLELAPTAWPSTGLYLYGGLCRRLYGLLTTDRGEWLSIGDSVEHLETFDAACESFDQEVMLLRYR